MFSYPATLYLWQDRVEWIYYLGNVLYAADWGFVMCTCDTFSLGILEYVRYFNDQVH